MVSLRRADRRLKVGSDTLSKPAALRASVCVGVGHERVRKQLPAPSRPPLALVPLLLVVVLLLLHIIRRRISASS